MLWYMVEMEWQLLSFILWACLERIASGNREEMDVFKPLQRWTSWSSWSECSVKGICMGGSRGRNRSCRLRPCFGVYEENEHCPKDNCKEIDIIPPILDVTAASFSSFISQECDADIKYSMSSIYAAIIPAFVRRLLRKSKKKFTLGYFNRKFLSGNGETHLLNMTKYCFEPNRMRMSEAMTLSYFNRTSRSSLYVAELLKRPTDDYIAGLTLVFDSNEKLVASYFAVRSSVYGYRNVFYRRWKGQGFEDFL